MTILIHYKEQQLINLLQELTDLQQLYLRRSLKFKPQFIRLLEDSASYFKRTGNSKRESEISQQQIYYETAIRGINPETLEKLRTGRTERIWISAFKAISESGIILRLELDEVNRKLAEGNELIEQIVLSAIQSKQILEDDLRAAQNIVTTEKIWAKLCSNEQIKLIDQKLRLQLNPKDIIILLNKIFIKINKS